LLPEAGEWVEDSMTPREELAVVRMEEPVYRHTAKEEEEHLNFSEAMVVQHGFSLVQPVK
jgi:hypothetical protein